MSPFRLWIPAIYGEDGRFKKHAAKLWISINFLKIKRKNGFFITKDLTAVEEAIGSGAEKVEAGGPKLRSSDFYSLFMRISFISINAPFLKYNGVEKTTW